MSTRDHTDIYLEYRHSFGRQISKVNSHIRRKKPQPPNNIISHSDYYSAEQTADDETRLLNHGESGSNSRISKLKNSENEHVSLDMRPISLPPQWIDDLNEVEESLKIIEQKIDKVGVLQNKNVLPGFDDSLDEEQDIESLSEQVTMDFQKCHIRIKKIEALTKDSLSHQEKLVGNNAVMSLASRLQSLSSKFRASQSSYIQRLRGRDEKANDFLISSGLDTYINSDFSNTPEITRQEMQQIFEQQEQGVEDRVQSVNEIAKSIFEIAEIFRDLQTLTIDQGTLLDRIDFNIEKTSSAIKPAYEQLQIADKYQKKARSKYFYFIIILIAIIVLLLIILITKHSRKT